MFIPCRVGISPAGSRCLKKQAAALCSMVEGYGISIGIYASGKILGNRDVGEKMYQDLEICW